jgi:hypothetical protein
VELTLVSEDRTESRAPVPVTGASSQSRELVSQPFPHEFTRSEGFVVSEGGLELRYLDMTSSAVSSRYAWSGYVFRPM